MILYFHITHLSSTHHRLPGIIHSDLKPANFLLVDGIVKLIDFGISSSIQNDMTSVVKDSQVSVEKEWRVMGEAKVISVRE